MGIGDIEMMDAVAKFSPVVQNVCTGGGTHFHDSFADRFVEAKGCRVANGLIHVLVSYPGHLLSLSRSTRCEGDFNRIGDIGLVDAIMNKPTLVLDVLQVLVYIAAENLLDLVVVKHGSQATSETLGASRIARAG